MIAVSGRGSQEARPLDQGHTERGQTKPAQPIRSLFVSDIHLGCKHAQADAFLELLTSYEPEHLYIVGDFIDGWKLKRRWRWLPVYDAILQRLMELKRSGTQLFYTPGNHDAFLRGFLADFGVIEIRDRFIHTTADGRRFLVTHGDQFDRVEHQMQWLSLIASYGYDLLLSANGAVSWLIGKKQNPYAFCGILKRRVKALVKHVSDFEQQIVDSAKDAACQGIICGHIHAPRIVQLDDLAYCNTGDWVENCSGMLEHADGSFELIRRNGRVIDHLPAPTAEAARSLPGGVGSPVIEASDDSNHGVLISP